MNNEETKDSIQELGVIKYAAKKTIDYLAKKKWLYKTVGVLAFGSLMTELSTIPLPDSLVPDYSQIVIDYGYPLAVGVGFLFGKYFNEVELIPVVTKGLILLICLWIDYKVQVQSGNKKTILNFFFGIIQNNKQDYY